MAPVQHIDADGAQAANVVLGAHEGPVQHVRRLVGADGAPAAARTGTFISHRSLALESTRQNFNAACRQLPAAAALLLTVTLSV